MTNITNRNIVISNNKGNLKSRDVRSSVMNRIRIHLEYIKKEEELILAHYKNSNIISDCIKRIEERKAKIKELEEFTHYCLDGLK